MTSLARRSLCAAGLAMTALGSHAQPADWPTKPVRLMVPAAVGTAPDIMARAIGEKLSAMWRQPVVVENKAGAGGLIGLTGVKTSTRDDHAFVFAPASVYAMAPYMYKSNQVDVVRDFEPVAMIAESPMLVAVSAASSANTLADMIAMARRDPDKFIVATTSQYSLPHLSADVLARAAGVPLRAVTYGNSGQSIAAVVNGDAQMLIDGIPPVESMIKANRLKALATFSDGRLSDRPQLPAVSETYPSLVINGWFGVVAPRGTRAQAIERVNRDIGTVLAMPDVVARFESVGVYPKRMTPAQFGTFWSDERTRWEKALRDVGAQPVMQ
jgi:tripartite-type tricarboxylate transporter receptor subunit TctC